MRIGWKKAGKNKNRLVKLQILGRVVSPRLSEGKRRTDKARVLSITKIDRGYGWRGAFETKTNVKSTMSSQYCGKKHKPVLYVVGKIVKPKNGLNLNRNKDCGAGINFFFEKHKALYYVL